MSKLVSRSKLFLIVFIVAFFVTQSQALPTVSAGGGEIDTNQWYRLTNSFLGEEYSLDTYGDTHEPFMGNSGNYSGQFWKLTPAGNGTYRLSNMFLGDGRSLDTYGDTHEPFMGNSGNYSGQFWKLTPMRDGTYRLSNLYLGNGRSLDTYSDTYEPFMGETGNYSGQFWKLTALGVIKNETAVLPNIEIIPEPIINDELDQNVSNIPTSTNNTFSSVGQACNSQNACASGLKCVDVSYLNAEYNTDALSQNVCMQDDASESVEQLKTLDYNTCSSIVGGPNVNKVAVFSNMADELNATVTVGVGFGSSAVIASSAEAGFMIGPKGEAGCYITQCFGTAIDIQYSIYENIGIFNHWDNVPGRAFVTSQGVSVPFIEAGYTTSQVLSGGDLVGAVNTFSVGEGILPVDLSGMACTTSIVQIRPELPAPNAQEVLSMRQKAQAEVNRLNEKIDKLQATILAERDNNTQHFNDAQADVQKEQDKLNRLNKEIKQMRNIIRAERAHDKDNLQTAQRDVNTAQQDVNSLQDEINSSLKKVDQINSAITAKKRWLDNKSFFDKGWAGPEYAAFASAKRIEQAALYSKIAGLEITLKTATGSLDIAKSSLYLAEAAINTAPVDADPRLVSLFTARDAANAGLEAAKFAVGATSDLLDVIPIESDPRMIDLYIELGLAKAELEVLG